MFNIQKLLLKIVIILSLTLIVSELIKEDKIIQSEQKNNKNEIILVKEKKLKKPILKIDAIDFEMVINKSDSKTIQKVVDQNKIVSLTDFSLNKYVVFGHYTNINNLVFNKIVDLRKNDTISILFNNKVYKYDIIDYGTTLRSEYHKLMNDKILTILTCTKNLDQELYYYVQAKYEENE